MAGKAATTLPGKNYAQSIVAKSNSTEAVIFNLSFRALKG